MKTNSLSLKTKRTRPAIGLWILGVCASYMSLLAYGENAPMKILAPKIAGDYAHVYKPAADIYPGPSAGPLEAGRRYDDWVANDHCFVRDDSGRWHVFGITHPYSGLQEVHAGEYLSFHAIAPKGPLKQALKPQTWRDEPKVLPPSERPGEIPENHAPCIEKVDGVYHMLYGPYPLRHATSPDLKKWTPQGPLTNSLATRDPNLFVHEGKRYVITCGVRDVRLAELKDYSACGESRSILTMEGNVDPESPTLLRHNGTFYLFVCGWNNVWDQKELLGAYQHVTYVYQSDDPFHFETKGEVARLDAHAPEIFQGEDGAWYISSAEWPHRGISIAPLAWK